MIEINGWLLLTQAVTFLVAMVLVWKLFWGPLTQFMHDRSARIEADLKRAESGRKEIESLEADYRQRLADLEARAQQEIKEALARGQQAKEQIIDEARREGRRVLEKAQTDLAAERERVVRELRAQVTEISLAAVEKLLGEGLDQKIQQRLLAKFLDELDQVRPAR